MSESALHYVPFDTVVDTAFWHCLAQRKLNIYKLQEGPFPLTSGFVNNHAQGVSPRVSIDLTSIDSQARSVITPNTFGLTGELWSFNSRDHFRTLDKQKFLNDFCRKHLLSAVESGDFLRKPATLNRVLAITYCDLKTYRFLFWFAYPALLHSVQPRVISVCPLSDLFNQSQLDSLADNIQTWRKSASENSPFFTLELTVEENSVAVSPLEKLLTNNNKVGDTNASSRLWLGFCDPSTSAEHPGWPLRNMLNALAAKAISESTELTVVCLRERWMAGSLQCGQSLVMRVQLEPIKDVAGFQFVGWERRQQKLQPRTVDLSASMDPTKLAEQAVDLNLKLMRWRLMPSLDLEAVRDTKCLLLGSGTLGCNTARQLLAWGVRHITFVDNAKISHSNPVRQTLFRFVDAQCGAHKAEAASKALQAIFPGVKSAWHNLSIMMPGHPVGNAALSAEENRKLREAAVASCLKLRDLIAEHDVVFLLLDTREARWLPTLFATSLGKLTMNGALGFDSYLVMRHGFPHKAGTSPSVFSAKESDLISGHSLGCYFCNDVIAPTNDRSMDQQCTVARPGTSMMASALLVELLVSILQHPEKGGCAAESVEQEQKSHPFGLIPHQIRGFLSSYNMLLPATSAFSKCSACSQPVLDAYASQGVDFLLRVFDDVDYLEDICGLKTLKQQTVVDDILILDDLEDI